MPKFARKKVIASAPYITSWETRKHTVDVDGPDPTTLTETEECIDKKIDELTAFNEENIFPIPEDLHTKIDQYMKAVAVKRKIGDIPRATKARYLLLKELPEKKRVFLVVVDDSSEQLRYNNPDVRALITFSPSPNVTAKDIIAVITDSHLQLANMVWEHIMFDLSESLLEFAKDPVLFVETKSKEIGICSICLRTLTSEASLERAMGPVCSKYLKEMRNYYAKYEEAKEAKKSEKS